jgi:hypothetical protein
VVRGLRVEIQSELSTLKLGPSKNFGGTAQLVERLIRNNALTNALTFSYALSRALPKVNLRLTRCLKSSQTPPKIGTSVQNRRTKGGPAFRLFSGDFSG